MKSEEVIDFFNDCLIQSAWNPRESEIFLITDGDLVMRITPSQSYGVMNILSFEIMERSEFEEIKRQT